MINKARIKALEDRFIPTYPEFYKKWGSDDLIPRPQRELTWEEVMGGKGPYRLSGNEQGIPQ
jgi:hypothetical protein